MQKLKHTSTQGAIKPINASSIAEAIINSRAPTRGEIAKSAGVTEMTVCRAVSILDEASFIAERATDNTYGAKLKLSLEPSLSFMVADVTEPNYSIYLFSSDLSLIEQHNHAYNHSIDADLNLNLFLEKAKAQFSAKVKHFSGIAVIFNNENFNDPTVCKAIEQSFGCPITASLKIEDCIKNLRTSAIDSKFPAESMYYLHIGNRNFAYFVNEKCAIKSNPQILVDKNGATVGELISTCITPEQAGDIIYSIVNAASAILDAKLFLVESDRFVLGKSMGTIIAEKLKTHVLDKRRLVISDSKPHYRIKGAVLALQKEIIKSILVK